jgi:hypothetical protein
MIYDTKASKAPTERKKKVFMALKTCIVVFWVMTCCLVALIYVPNLFKHLGAITQTITIRKDYVSRPVNTFSRM